MSERLHLHIVVVVAAVVVVVFFCLLDMEWDGG